MIAYSQFCLPCTHKEELQELKNFASSNGLKLEVKQVSYSKEWQAEAAALVKKYRVKMPFAFNEGKAVKLGGDYSKLLPKTVSSDE